MGYTVDGRKIIQQKYHYIQYITISISISIVLYHLLYIRLQASNTCIIFKEHLLHEGGEMDNT